MSFTEPRAIYHNDGSIELITPFSEAFVSMLKSAIPGYARRWNPDTKAWLIAGEYRVAAWQILRAFFPHAQSEAAEAHTSHRCSDCNGSARPIDPDRAVLFVTDDAPVEVIGAAYKALSKLFHPDRGGSLEKMKEINASYGRLQQRIQARGAA